MADWQPLAESDPIPGDPYEVATLGRELRNTADEIRRQVDNIRKLCTDEYWDSDAGREYRTKAHDTADRLEKAFARYDEAAGVIGTVVDAAHAAPDYATQLDRAQQMARSALLDAQNADSDQRAATASLAQMTPAQAGSPEHTAATNRQQQAGSDLDAARRKLAEAVEIRDAAANRAAGTIKQVSHHDGLHDSGWDKFKHAALGALKIISQVAGWVAAGAGLMSLMVAWIPVIGPALAAVLDSVAVIASVVALGADLILAVTGQGNWADVLLDGVGLLTFGVGRAAIKGGEGTLTVAKTAEKTGAEAAANAGRNMTKTAKAQRFLDGVQTRNAQRAFAKGRSELPRFRSRLGEGLGHAFNPITVGKDFGSALKGVFQMNGFGQLAHWSNYVLHNMEFAEQAGHLSKYDFPGLKATMFRTQWVVATGTGTTLALGNSANNQWSPNGPFSTLKNHLATPHWVNKVAP